MNLVQILVLRKNIEELDRVIQAKLEDRGM